MTHCPACGTAVPRATDTTARAELAELLTRLEVERHRPVPPPPPYAAAEAATAVAERRALLEQIEHPVVVELAAAS